MRTTWEEHGLRKTVVSPLSLVVSAFAPCDDVRAHLDAAAADRPGDDRPRLRRPRGRPKAARRLDPGAGLRADRERGPRRRRPGPAPGSLRRARRAARGRARPRLPRPVGRRALHHPGRDGVRRAHRPPRRPRRPRRPRGRHRPHPGRSLQRGAGRAAAVPHRRPGARAGPSSRVTASRASSSAPRTRRTRCGSPAAPARSSASRAPRCSGCGPRPPGGCSRCATTPSPPARSTTASSTRGDPGLSPLLTFDPADDVAAPSSRRGARPRMAILREQGVNGQVEMAAAFDRAGFEASTST